MKLYVGNLSSKTTDTDLSSAFERFGTVESASVVIRPENCRSLGYGFVEIADENKARKAIVVLDGSVLHDRTIDVSEVKPSRGGPGRHDSWG